MVALSDQEPVAKGFTCSNLPTGGFFHLFMQKMLAQPGLQNIRRWQPARAIIVNLVPLLRKQIAPLSTWRRNKLPVSRGVVRYPIISSPRHFGRLPSDVE